jgi:hypothetical protein
MNHILLRNPKITMLILATEMIGLYADHADLESNTCRCKSLKWHQHHCHYSWRQRVCVPTLSDSLFKAEFIRFSNPQPSKAHSVVGHRTNEFIYVCACDFCDRTTFS